MDERIKAPRYCAKDNAWLQDAILNFLPVADFESAKAFYEKWWKEITRRRENVALLGANDRFFLFTQILGRKDGVHPWLYDRCREVEADPFGHLDLWARYHYKSSLITFAGSIQGIVADPEITIGIFSATNKIARPFLLQIKDELERNANLRRAYPDVIWDNPKVQAPRWSVDGGLVVRRKGNPKEATVEAFGLLDGMPTGRHFKRLVYDDLINQEHVSNPEMVAKVTERWELSDNLGVGEETEIITVGTRYSFADTYGIMMERGALKPRLYPATDNGRLDGNPVFLSKEHWEKVKNKQRSTAAAQMLQNPIAGKENTFKPEWLQRWEVRPSQLSVYIMCDPSGGRSKKSDRTAVAVIGLDGRGNKFFLDGYRHRMSLTERWQAVKTLHMKWSRQPGVVHVSVGYEKYGMQSDLEYFQERMREEGYDFRIEEINWPREGQHSKQARVERLEPDVRVGRFYFPALVYEPGKGECYWHVDEKQSTLVRVPVSIGGPTAAMKRMMDSGHDYLVAKPIRRVDEDKKIYDVTMALMEEMLFFPFAPHDDLVDAASRIYDMDVIVPSIFEDKEVSQINDRDWVDA